MVAIMFAAALAAAQNAGQVPPPGPIEQAVIEHRCAGTRNGASPSIDPYHDCLAAQLAGLRADFGADLKQLTAADRRKLDAACNRVRTFEGRDRYVACLSERLAARQGGNVARPSSGPEPAVPDTPLRTQAAMPATPADRSSRNLWIAMLAIAAAAAAAGGSYLFSKRPVKTSLCHACGITLEGAGDLCPGCRHEAAEARRRAMAAANH